MHKTIEQFIEEKTLNNAYTCIFRIYDDSFDKIWQGSIWDFLPAYIGLSAFEYIQDYFNSDNGLLHIFEIKKK